MTPGQGAGATPAAGPRPAVPPGLDAGVLAAMVLGLLSLYFEGIPNKVANPLYGVGVLLLAARAATAKEGVRVGLPLALAATCLALVAADMAARAFLVRPMYYRPLEQLTGRHPLYPELVRFTPSARIEMESFGDIAAVTADPALRQPRRIEFVTDELGYRNPPGTAARPLDGIALGDSFTLGAGSTQADMWTRQLEAAHGRTVYDLAFPADPAGEVLLLKAVLPSLSLKPGTTVIWSLFEGNDFRPATSPSLALPPPQGPVAQWQTALAVYRNRSPVRMVLRRFTETHPAGGRPALSVGRLVDGAPMLFYGEYLDEVTRRPAPSDPGLEAVVRAVDEMRRFTREQQLSLLVLGLPVKARVYPGLLPEGAAPPPEPSPFLAFLERTCTDRGLEYLDVTELLRQRAEAGGLLWWRDDTHWNRAGHELVAELVYQKLWGSGPN